MPVRPALVGLVKHQLMFSQGTLESSVTTIWTHIPDTAPSAARIAAEKAQIVAWITSHWRGITGAGIFADRVKTWNFGVSPPAKYGDTLVFPRVSGTGGAAVIYGVSAVVALRTQPVGSAIRNRNNGRIFHPIGAGMITFPAGAINGAGTIVTAYHNLRDRLNPALVADVGRWSVVSWRTGHAWRAVPLVTPVDHVLVYGQIGFQESRMGNQPAYDRGA